MQPNETWTLLQLIHNVMSLCMIVDEELSCSLWSFVDAYEISSMPIIQPWSKVNVPFLDIYDI